MGKINYKLLIFFAIFFAAGTNLFAHPHVNIENITEFVWEKGQLTGAYLEWTFCRFFSADIINWLDIDKDGQFSEEESVEVYNKAFINLRHYYYYTFIRQGTKRTNPPSVSEFRATQADGIITYRFFIDLSDYSENELFFAVYDYTFYCNIHYPDEIPVLLDYDSTYVQPEFSVVENQSYPVYYDPLGAASDTTVYYEWKQGLQTYYPREIKLTW